MGGEPSLATNVSTTQSLCVLPARPYDLALFQPREFADVKYLSYEHQVRNPLL